MTGSTSHKPLLSEQEAVAHFVFFMLEEAQRKWPVIYENYQKHVHERFAVRDEMRAPYDLAFATIALNLQSIQHLYAAEQANRIESKILEQLAQSKGWGTYAVKEVRNYSLLFRNELQEMGPGTYPIRVVAFRLLRQWLGIAHENIEAQLGAQLVAMAMKSLSELSDLWEKTVSDFELLEGDSHWVGKDENSWATRDAKPRVFVVSDETSLLELIPMLLSKTDCEVTGSLSMRGRGWEFGEVLADAIAFQPNALMFCINCHLCPEIDGVDIPRMLFRQFPDARIIVTRMGYGLNITEAAKNMLQKQGRHFHVIDVPFNADELSAVLWLDRN